MHNSTHAQLVVQEVNGTELGAVDMVVNVAAVWDLSEIAGEGLMTWGGQNPDTIRYTAQIAKKIGLISITHQSDTIVSDRCITE